MKRPLGSLRSRVFAATTAVAVLPIAAALLLVSRGLTGQAEAELASRLEEAARLVERYHRARLDLAGERATLVADLPRLKAAVNEADPRHGRAGGPRVPRAGGLGRVRGRGPQRAHAGRRRHESGPLEEGCRPRARRRRQADRDRAGSDRPGGAAGGGAAGRADARLRARPASRVAPGRADGGPRGDPAGRRRVRIHAAALSRRCAGCSRPMVGRVGRRHGTARKDDLPGWRGLRGGPRAARRRRPAAARPALACRGAAAAADAAAGRGRSPPSEP